MVSPQGFNKLGSNAGIEKWDHDPGATTAIIVSPDGGTTKRFVDMRDFERFAVAAMVTIVAAGGMTKLEIVAADDATGTNTIVIKDSGTIAADAVGDWAFEECSAAEVEQESNDAGFASRFVAGRITMATSTDEAAVTYIPTRPKFPQKDLTPATTIA